MYSVHTVHAPTAVRPCNRGLAPVSTSRTRSSFRPSCRLGSLCTDSKSHLLPRRVRNGLLPRQRWCTRTADCSPGSVGINLHTAGASTTGARSSSCALSSCNQYSSNLQDTACLQQPALQPSSTQPRSSSTILCSINTAAEWVKAQATLGHHPAEGQQSSAGAKTTTHSAAIGAPLLHQPSSRLRSSKSASLQQSQQQHALSSSSGPPAPWGLAGASALPVPRRSRGCHFTASPYSICSSRRDAVRLGAFAGAAAVTASGNPWHQALGLNLRGILWGIAFTLGSQLLLALLLRTLWAQRAIAALESWLQTAFGISIRRSPGSAAVSMEEEDDEVESASTGAAASRSSSISSSSSASSAGSEYSSSSTFSSRIRGKKARAAERAARAAALVEKSSGESVEWVNMCFRKIWRVYQRGLERWITDLLQPVFDGLIQIETMPKWLLRLRIVELTFDHEAPYFSNMRRRNSRKDSDLTGVVDLRYTGGARMLLMLELGQGRWRFKIPVLVSDLDVQCSLWLKLRLAPMCPWIGTISLAFVGPPAVKVQLSPYNRVRLMRIPVLQNLLNRLLTVDLPALMVLPERLEISVPPSVTSIAEAAVGRDTIMRAVASAVLQVDSLEQALLAALPLGPQAAAGGVSLPDFFRGELTVHLRGGRDLPVWGMPWQSNPWVRLVLGDQAVASRRDSETSTASRHGAPVWNQEVQFLVEDPDKQVLEVYVNDSHLTGRPKVGKAVLPLKELPSDGHLSMWVPLEPVNPGQQAQGEVLLDITFKPFEDDEQDSGYREAQEYARTMQQQSEAITDIRSAAAASSRAAVAASAAISAIAMTKAAAARAAARAAQAAKDAGTAALNTAAAALPQQSQPQQQQQATQQQQQATQQQQQQPLMLPPPSEQPISLVSIEQQEQIATAAAKKAADVASRKQKGKDHHDDDNGGPPSGGNGTAAATADEAAAAAAAKRREEALIEALEARMDFKVRRTGAPKSSSPVPSANGNGTPVSGNSGSTLDVSVTLPADSMSSSSTDDEDVAVEKAQRAVADILDKSKRMEAAVAELAALTAGSPTEAALQQGAVKAAADAVATLSAMRSMDKQADAGSVVTNERPQQRQQQRLVSGNGNSKGSSNGSSRSFGSFGSIWGDEQPKREKSSPKQQQQQHHHHHYRSLEELESGISDYSVWGEEEQQQQQAWEEWAAAQPVHALQQQQQQQQHEHEQQHLPNVVVRLTDGEHVHSQVVGGSGQSTPPPAAVAAAEAPTVDFGTPETSELVSLPVSNKVQAAMTDESTAAAVTKVAAEAAVGASHHQQQQQQQSAQDQDRPWWSNIIFSLPGQKGTEAAAATEKDGVAPTASAADIDPSTAMLDSEPISHAHRAWWQPLLDNDFVRSLPGIKKQDRKQQDQDSSSAAAKTLAAAAAGKEPQQQQQQEEEAKEKVRNWWENWDWLPRFGGSVDDLDDGAAAGSSSSDGANKPVESIVIPADLPLEEIAKEVAKLKEDAWRSKEDHLESLWAKTVERNDRSWIMLLCFLLTVVIGLLAVVAYRIANMSSGGDAAAVIDAATVLGQLPLLLTLMAAAVGVTYYGGGL